MISWIISGVNFDLNFSILIVDSIEARALLLNLHAGGAKHALIHAAQTAARIDTITSSSIIPFFVIVWDRLHHQPRIVM